MRALCAVAVFYYVISQSSASRTSGLSVLCTVLRMGDGGGLCLCVCGERSLNSIFFSRAAISLYAIEMPYTGWLVRFSHAFNERILTLDSTKGGRTAAWTPLRKDTLTNSTSAPVSLFILMFNEWW